MSRTLIRTAREYDTLVRELKADPKMKVAVDTETTGLRLYKGDRPVGMSLTWRGRAGQYVSWYLPIGHAPSPVHNRDAKRVLRALKGHPTRWHNTIFDTRSLSLAGPWDFPDIDSFEDSGVNSWLMDENIDHRLKPLGKAFIRDDADAEQKDLKKMLRGGKTWADLTAHDAAEYAMEDTELTYEVDEVLPNYRGFPDEPTRRREKVFQRVLYNMIATGIRIDPKEARRQQAVAGERMEEIRPLFGGVNLNSPQQLARMIFDEWELPVIKVTKAGNRSTARDVLEQLADPRMAELLEYRRLQKAWSSYYVPLQETMGEDGRIHAGFSSWRTVTGRLSCSDPNLQTIPRDDTLHGVRKLFVPAPGYDLWEFDLAQAELRVQASYSGDHGLAERLEAGVDLHSWIAEEVFGPDFTPLHRRFGKNLNYGFSYGIGPRKFALYMLTGAQRHENGSFTLPTGEHVPPNCAAWSWQVGMPGRRPHKCGDCIVCRAATILDGYRAANPELVRFMKGMERVAKRDGEIAIWERDGAQRVRHFTSPGRLQKYYTALNALVQGGVAELMKDIMIAMEHIWPEEGARLCLQVHDSLVAEVKPKTGPKLAGILQDVCDKLNPFEMRMLFDAAPWESHA